MNNFNSKLALTPCLSVPSQQKPVAMATTPITSQFQIRLCSPADLTGVAQIIAESFHSRDGLWGWAFPLLRLGIYEDLRHRLATSAPHHACLVAVDNCDPLSESLSEHTSSNLVATVELSVRLGDSWTHTGTRKSFAYLSNLAVHPHYRRQGAARALLASCEKVVSEWGFNDLYLHVLENNHQARQLYFKLGYRMHQVDANWNTFLFRHSRQMLLYKHLFDC
ncbi:GNAT family N-acetyltransferase [Plectonema cf. radiosum LEGE 06105]|uniref:GNAT family N-acetyltransferase n=1 Tax=Plectonema cf. radiosum LEGE 06105 TaxID=945769 RepID=A0A8J7F6J0_9CYAN|nr:GNAT family N-acetyltransferase [Plectonema radiosum]MBE9214910.1 GNAT family N-acetyltransferase [Plectonema cf. radiosum LEGE 06105]